MRIPLLAALALLGPTAALSAQAIPADWSRIIAERRCHPDFPCSPRAGLTWDESNPIPRYPQVMRNVGIGGPAIVRFLVRPDGTVDPGSIRFESVINRAFERPTLEAVEQWRFGSEMADRPDEPIPVRLRIAYAITTGCGFKRETSGQAAWSTDEGARTLVITSGCPYRVPPSEVRSLKEG